MGDGCQSHGWIRHRAVAIRFVCYRFRNEGGSYKRHPVDATVLPSFPLKPSTNRCRGVVVFYTRPHAKDHVVL